jgi:hypothetical protein
MNKKISLCMLLGFVFSVSAAPKIYKYVDKNGTIHYSEKKPFADAKEADINANITIVESSKVEPRSTRKRIEHKIKQEAAKVESFTMDSPVPGSTLWGTGGNILASVSLESVASNHRINFFLDNVSRGKVKSNSQLIADVERGEHTIYATLIDVNTRSVIKTTPVITFYLQQTSKK